MGLGSFISADSDLPPAKKTLVQTILNPVFGVLDAPGNATRSLVSAMTHGDLSLIGNAALSLVPGGGARYVSGAEAFRTESFWKGLGAELVLDPLLLVNSIGKATKVGKAARHLVSLKNQQRAFVASKKFDKAEEISDLLKKAADDFNKFSIEEKLGRKRSLFSLGIPGLVDIPIGDVKKAKEFIASLPIGALPDARKIALTEEHAREQIAIAKLTDEIEELRAVKGVQPGTIQRKLDTKAEKISKTLELEKAIAAGPSKVTLPPSVANQLTKMATWRKAHFGGKSDELVEGIEDITSTGIAKDESFLGKERALYTARVAELATKESVEQVNVLNRLVDIGESRGFAKKHITRSGKPVWLVGEKQIPNVEQLSDKASELILNAEKRAEVAWEKLSKLDNVDEIEAGGKRILAKLDDDISNIELEHSRLGKFYDRVAKGWFGKDKEHYTPEELSLAHILFEDFDKMVAASNAQRIAINTLDPKVVDYVRRLMTSEAKKLRRIDKNKYNSILAAAKVSLGAAYKRRLMPHREIGEVNKLLRKQYGIDFDFFSRDAVEIAIERKLEHSRNIHRAVGANAVVTEYARVSDEGMTAVKFLEKAGLDPGKIGGMEAIDPALRIPQKIVDQFTKYETVLQKSIFNETALVKALGWMDKHVNAGYRIGLTTLFPAYHNRNIVSNWFLNAMAGVYKGRHYWNASRLQKAVAKGTATVDEFKLWEELVEHRVAKGGLYEEFEKLTGGTPIRRALEKGVAIPGTKFKLGLDIEKPGRQFLEPIFGKRRFHLGTGKAFGAYAEDNARIAHYFAKRGIRYGKKGLEYGKASMTKFEAMRSVNKYLFDYSKLTGFEKKIMRPMFLFYTWTRKNVPLMVETSIRNPRIVSQYQKFIGQGREEVPDYLRVSSVIPNPFGKGFISDPGNPLVDLNIFNVEDVDPGNAQGLARAAEKVVSRMSPIPKMIYEIMTGRSSFSRRPIRNLWGDWIKPSLPTSRIARTVTQAFDEERSTTMRLLNTLTGVRHYTFSKLKGKRAQLERRAISTGKIKRLGDTFILMVKAGYEDDPEVKVIMRQIAQVNREIRREKAKR